MIAVESMSAIHALDAELLLLDAADMDEVLAWARKNARVFRGPVEVREIFFAPEPE